MQKHTKDIINIVLVFISGLLVGILVGMIGAITDGTPEKHINNQEGLVKVTIISKHTNDKGRNWSLLEADDGQRCYIYKYRGTAGTSFWITPDQLYDYVDTSKINKPKERIMNP